MPWQSCGIHKSGPEETLQRWSGHIKTISPRWPHAQASKYLCYTKEWPVLRIWSDHGLGSLGCSAGHANAHNTLLVSKRKQSIIHRNCIHVVLLDQEYEHSLSVADNNSFESRRDKYPESLLSARCGVDAACGGNALILESPERDVEKDDITTCLPPLFYDQLQ